MKLQVQVGSVYLFESEYQHQRLLPNVAIRVEPHLATRTWRTFQTIGEENVLASPRILWLKSCIHIIVCTKGCQPRRYCRTVLLLPEERYPASAIPSHEAARYMYGYT